MKVNRPSSDLARYRHSSSRISNLVTADPLTLSVGDMTSDGPAGHSLWSVLDDRMRGRWRWAILLGLGLSVLLGSIGYFAATPMYRSVGAVRVAQQVPVVLHMTDLHTQAEPDRFRATQVHLIKNPRVLEQALADDEVKRLPASVRPANVKAIQKHLDVDREPQSELIYVVYESTDPTAAEAVANAVIRTYYEIYGKYNGQDVPGTLLELKDNEARFTRELNMLQMQRRAIDTVYQSSDLLALQHYNMDLLANLDAQIRTARRDLDRAARNRTGAPASPDLVPDLATLEQINPMLARRRQEWGDAQIAFDNIKDRYLPGRSLYTNAKERAVRTKSLYDEEYQKTIDQWTKAGSKRLVVDGVAKPLTADDVAALEREYAELAQRQQKLVVDIAKREDLINNEQAAQKELDRIRDRKHALEIEAKNLGQFISIAYFAARENEPSSNVRRKFAIAGSGLGLMGTFVAFFVLGTIDRRAFAASQLMPHAGGLGSRVPNCLGVLPDLGTSLNDPENHDVASHCVHQIRNQIEALRDQRRGYVLAVSSPFQGDGKTSIVMALGWSYAAAGYNTLVVDCDLIGRSLTRQLGLVGREGLRDALVMGELNGSVSRLPVANLSAVPAGLDGAFGPENLRHSDLQILLAPVRESFDIILVDTGPLFGSLESTPVMRVADGVVLSVRRGRSRNRLEECVDRLGQIGTRCLGVVLNCAKRSDCYRYVSEASLAAAEEGRLTRPETATDANARQRQSPGERNALVRAMQRTTRFHRTTK